jgi:hypothetical protein
MTSYRIEIKQCPYCDGKSPLLECVSSNTFGAQAYTDGCIVGPMHDFGSALMTCQRCGRHQWLEDVPTLKSMSEREYGSLLHGNPESYRNRHPELGSPQPFFTDHYEDALHQELWKTEAQEKYIRIRAWWSFNNTYREKTTTEINLTPEQEANLLKLLQLLNKDNPETSIMKAEVFRELGQFDECLKQLDQPFDIRYLSAVNAIKKLANCKKRHVGTIERPSQTGLR